MESMDAKARAFAFLFKDYQEHLPAILSLHKTRGGMSRFEKFEMIYRDFLKQPLTEEKKQALGRQFSDFAYQEVLKSSFVEGAQDFLEKYYQRFPLFIASGTPDGEMKSIVRDRGLEKYFKEVYGSPLKKKDIILKIMKEFGFQSQEVIFVGDSIDDEEGAKGAGVRFILRTKENNPFSQLNKIINI